MLSRSKVSALFTIVLMVGILLAAIPSVAAGSHTGHHHKYRHHPHIPYSGGSGGVPYSGGGGGGPYSGARSTNTLSSSGFGGCTIKNGCIKPGENLWK